MLYCPLPWIHSAIRNNGDFRVCCQSNVSADRGILRNDGVPLNAKTTPLSQTRNSQTLKNVRQKLMAGEWPESCERCRKEEATGLRSRRSYENETWSHLFDGEKALAVTSSDGGIEEENTPLLFLDVRFGNKCNLKCRMCGPTDSDFWYQDQGELWGPIFHDTHGKVELKKNHEGKWKDEANTYDWYSENPSFWMDLEKNSLQIKKINVVGGEPLLIEQHYDFLEKMVSQGYASNVTLEYNTNLTVLPQKALNLWREFSKVRVGVSVDGFDHNNSYIRSPSKWNVLVKNLNRLEQAEGPLELWLSATVQALNAFEITELIDWKINRSGLHRFNRSRRLPVITSHALHKPDFLSLKVLPAPVKKEVEKHYRTFIEEKVSTWNCSDQVKEHIRALLQGYSNFMNSEDLNASYFSKFIKYTKALDLKRNESLEIGAPLLHKALKKHESASTDRVSSCIP